MIFDGAEPKGASVGFSAGMCDSERVAIIPQLRSSFTGPSMLSSRPQRSRESTRSSETNSSQENAAPSQEWLSASEVGNHKKAEEALIRSEKLASLGRLASAVAHEINNPVAAVMNLLFLAKNNPGCPKAVKEDIVKAEVELMRISQVTRQVLDFYREPVAPGPVSLRAVLEETLELFQPRIMAKSVTLETRYSGGPQILGLAADFKQVFSSFISNSLDAVQAGGTVKLRISATNRAARITIADNGHGVDSSTKPQVFKLLFTTKESIGTGLGLWASKQLIEKYGGSIRFRSSTDGAHRGTTFVIKLPLTATGSENG